MYSVHGAVGVRCGGLWKGKGSVLGATAETATRDTNKYIHTHTHTYIGNKVALLP